MTFDWREFEQAVHDGVVAAVQRVARERSGERIYAAVLDRIPRESDGVIGLPALAINTHEALVGREAVRWSPPDWGDHDDDWLPDGETWTKALTADATASTTRHWEQTFQRYRTALVRVCKRARRTLRAARTTDRAFVVLLFDHPEHEELIRQILPTAEVLLLFPQFDDRAAAQARLAALPPGERAAEFAAVLDTFAGPVTFEDAETGLRALGREARPALLTLLRKPGGTWKAARLLADIGGADEIVVGALRSALRTTTGPDQAWSARALSRLGRLDLVFDQEDALPRDVIVAAIAAPYVSNLAVDPPPLDYGPLVDVLEQRPTYAPDLAVALKPGTSYRALAKDEVRTAVAALRSPHLVVRRHAVSVLGERRLARRPPTALVETMQQDDDPSVRRLAILSLLEWRRDSLHLAESVREALHDPAAEVRETATYWLAQQSEGGQ